MNKPKMFTLGRSKVGKQRLWVNLAGTQETRPQKQEGNVRASIHFLDPLAPFWKSCSPLSPIGMTLPLLEAGCADRYSSLLMQL